MNERAVFDAAIEIADAAERAAFLASACGDDAALRSRISELVADYDRLGSFMALPAGPADGTAAFPPRVGDLIVGQTFAGRFKIREDLGEGGMGVVFVADQTEPVQRRVALKVIRAGADSARVLARFEQERQALALMDHPNIAKVLDAGVSETGQPYFVMELIKGVPLTKYCDEAKLNPHERLELFISVCQAVQHAHQKGIIHRDLKPSNILVGLYDGRPVPKVIDFGVAKATGPRLSEQSIYTEVGSVIGTFEYMSPEQAELNNLDIDTRSDIYALGVILYELLTGTVPFSRKELESAGFAEMLRVIKEQEPPKPSTRLSASRELPSVAAQRHTEPAKLSKLLLGDLDWITMKALEKDRARRYETANGFAMDVQRYLANEPVLAGPPSATYRMRKFVRRNRGAVLAAALIGITLLAGIVGTTTGLVRARLAEGRAMDAAAAEKAANEQAQKRLAQVQKGNDILAAVFDDFDPRQEKPDRPLRAILGERLIRAADQLDSEALGDPLAVADLQQRLGHSLFNLGLAERAIPLFAKAQATRAARLGPDHVATLTSMDALAAGYWDIGKLNEAIPLWEETLRLTRAKLGADHRDTLACMSNLAAGYHATGKLSQALLLGEDVVKLAKVKLGDDHPDTLTAMGNLVRVYQDAGQFDRALLLAEESLRLSKNRLGADHPDTLTQMHNLALGHQFAGQPEKAVPLYEEALRGRRAKLSAEHPETLETTGNLGSGYEALGQLERALTFHREAAGGVEKRQFRDKFAGTVVMNLAACLEQAGQLQDAETWRRKWLAVVRDRDGTDSLPFADALAGLGLNSLKQNRWNEAEAAFRQSLTVREARTPESWLRFSDMSRLGEALCAQKKFGDAEPLMLAGYDGMTQREMTIPLRIRQSRHIEALQRLVQLYEDSDRPADAAKWRSRLEASKKR